MGAYEEEEVVQEAVDEVDVVEVLAGVAEGGDEEVAEGGLVEMLPGFELELRAALGGAVEHVGGAEHAEEEGAAGDGVLGQHGDDPLDDEAVAVGVFRARQPLVRVKLQRAAD